LPIIRLESTLTKRASPQSFGKNYANSKFISLTYFLNSATEFLSILGVISFFIPAIS
jgi:hypothetical protein